MHHYLNSLIGTIIIELSILCLLNKKFRSIHSVFVVIAIHFLTHPFLLFFLEKDFNLWLLEILIVLIEGILYYRFININLKIALVLSLIANTLSYVVGILV